MKPPGKRRWRDVLIFPYPFYYFLNVAFVVVLTALAWRTSWPTYPASVAVIGMSLIIATGMLRPSGKSSSLLSHDEAFFATVLSATVTILSCAILYLSDGLLDPAGTDGTVTFRDAIVFSIETFVSRDHGDRRQAPPVRLIAALQAMSGYVHLGLLIGLVVSGFTPWTGRTGASSGGKCGPVMD